MSRKRSEVVQSAVAPSELSFAATMRAKLGDIRKQLNETFIGREDAIEAMLLAHLVGENYMFVGVPGTAKSAVSTAFVKHIRARHFKVQFGAFTTPEKVFGPMDVEAFTVHKRYEHAGSGKLQDTDLATLDELLKSPDGMANEMLSSLNEREFMDAPIPLWCAGASTNWPEYERRSDKVAALLDRMLLRVAVRDLDDADEIARMLEASENVSAYVPRTKLDLADLKCASAELQTVQFSDDARKLLANVRNRLAFKRTSSGDMEPAMAISARRLATLQKVLRAQAWLAGDSEVTAEHFVVLRHGLWTDRADIEAVGAVLKTIDQEAVQGAIKLLGEAISVVRDFVRRNGVGADAMHAKVTDVSERVLGEFARPIFTARGREQIKVEIDLLKKEYTAATKSA